MSHNYRPIIEEDSSFVAPADLDEFLSDVYNYYVGGGLKQIVIVNVLEIL